MTASVIRRDSTCFMRALLTRVWLLRETERGGNPLETSRACRPVIPAFASPPSSDFLRSSAMIIARPGPPSFLVPVHDLCA